MYSTGKEIRRREKIIIYHPIKKNVKNNLIEKKN